MDAIGVVKFAGERGSNDSCRQNIQIGFNIDALPVPEIEALSLTKLHTSGGRRNM